MLLELIHMLKFNCGALIFILAMININADSLIISPPKELRGEPVHGIELKISLALDPDQATNVNGKQGILATVILKNDSKKTITFRDDFDKGGPFDFVLLDTTGKSTYLYKPLIPNTESFSGRLEQLKSGESRQYEQRISGQFLSAVIQGQVIGGLKFWENADQITEELLKKDQLSVWSDSARLDLKQK
jgi:hypothetical protein